MTARARRIEPNAGENIFETAMKEAKNPEPTVKEAVFIPPEDVHEDFAPTNTPKKVEKEEKPAKNVNESDIMHELRTILNVQRGKRAVPSYVTFFSVRSNAYRHVIIDVTDSIIEEAWLKYQEMAPAVDEEEFLGMVYSILEVDVPRMYRAVAPVVLKRVKS